MNDRLVWSSPSYWGSCADQRGDHDGLPLSLLPCCVYICIFVIELEYLALWDLEGSDSALSGLERGTAGIWLRLGPPDKK